MYIPPPEHPDMNLIRERHRREAADRDARNGRFRGRAGSLTTGDVIILIVLGVIVLSVTWFVFAWLLG